MSSGLLLLLVWCVSIFSPCQANLNENDEPVTDMLLKMSEQIVGLFNEMADLKEKVTKMDKKEHAIISGMQMLQGQLETLQRETISSTGPTYIRWGRTTCDGTNSQMVYTGVAGGSESTSAGGGANLLCLPSDPSFGNYDPVGNGAGIAVHGVEYGLPPDSNFPFENDDPRLLDTEVPCVVCQITDGSSVLMVPARVACYPGWSMEYRGYLMSEAYNTCRSEYVCVDKNPEPYYTSAGGADSVRLHPVEGHCASLPCPPYASLRELACVVCSK